MRRRRRAAIGPVGGMGGSFNLDVILHLDCKICQEQILGLWEYYGRTSGEWNVTRSGPNRRRDRRITILRYARASEPRRKHCYVNELLTHYTSLNFRGKA